MYRLLTGSLALPALLALGCEQPSNVEHCKDACAAAQALPCMEDIALYCDHEYTCPITWDEDGLDYTDYIDCVYGRYTCDGDGNFEYVDDNCVQPSAEG